MSSIKVPIVRISELRAHSNPEVDRLEVAIVEGWQLCVPKGRYRVGDRVTYFEQGTVISRELADEFGVTQYLSEKVDINGNKVLVVHRVKLKGEPSFGLAIDVAKDFQSLPDGTDLADHYEATKFMPPVRIQVGDAEVDHPMFPKYTEIENMRSYPDVFRLGDWVVATEKIHGTNSRVGFIVDDYLDMVFMAGSRTLRRKFPNELNSLECSKERRRQILSSNAYWSPLALSGVEDLLYYLYEEGHIQVVLFGEVFGSKIQSYDYGQKNLGFRAFDLMVDGKYLPFAKFVALMNQFAIPRVPVVYEGPFIISEIAKVSNGPTCISEIAQHGREGVVVRPFFEEREDSRIGRCVLKYVGDDYLFSKNGGGKDTTDQ